MKNDLKQEAREKKMGFFVNAEGGIFWSIFHLFHCHFFVVAKKMTKLLLIKIVPCICCVHFNVRCVCMVTPAANVRTLFCVQNFSM